VSIKVMEWVWNHSSARDGQLLVLLAIADNANHEGRNAFPSIAELCRKSRLSQRGVRYALRGLEEAGCVITTPQAGPGGCNRYQVVMDPAEIAAPPADIAGGQILQDGNLQQQGGQSVTEEVSQIAPVTVLEPSTNPKDISSPIADAPGDPVRDDVERICQHLSEQIAANGSRRPKITKGWRTQARLLLDKDGRTEAQVHNAIVWCQNDPFWKANIMSMQKLREKYDQLRLAAQRNVSKQQGPNWDAALERARQGTQRLEIAQ
jgi:hypothetical protein